MPESLTFPGGNDAFGTERCVLVGRNRAFVAEIGGLAEQNEAFGTADIRVAKRRDAVGTDRGGCPDENEVGGVVKRMPPVGWGNRETERPRVPWYCGTGADLEWMICPRILPLVDAAVVARVGKSVNWQFVGNAKPG